MVKEAINEQLKGLPRAIMVTTMLQTRLAEHRGSTDADPDVKTLMPRMVLRVRHAMEQMSFASGDEVDCVYARVKGDHHLLMVLSWSQGSEAFEDEEWKATKRRIQGPQDHLGRSVERAAKRQGASHRPLAGEGRRPGSGPICSGNLGSSRPLSGYPGAVSPGCSPGSTGSASPIS